MKTETPHTAMKSRLKLVLFSILLGMLFLPVVQEWTGVFPKGKLAGVENLVDTIPLTQSTWLSAEFQQNFELRHYGWMGFRTPMVRLRNQLDYSFFGETFRSVIVGENGEVVRRSSMEAMRGLNFVGTQVIDYNAEHTAILQRHFAERGVRMLVVITPSKLRCSPEILPEYDLFANPDNNYNRYLEAFKKYNVDYLNLTSVLQGKMKEGNYRMFPKTGTHWTDIGAFYGAEFITTEMTRRGGKQLPAMRIRGTVRSAEMRDTDADAGDLLNLIADLPVDSLYYPDSIQIWPMPAAERPKTLVVGDSFWWKIYNQDIHKRAFAPGSQYRYYNYEVFSDQWKGAKLIGDFDLRGTVENVEWVILCVNEGNLHRYPFDFVDQVLRMYYK